MTVTVMTVTLMTSGQARRPGPRRSEALLAALVAASFLAAPSQAVATTASWPALVRQAMGYAAPRTRVPLEAPTGRLWPTGRPGGPNSARVTAGADRYEVEIYTCPQPLPLNAPGIGKGLCGDMASIYGGFGGQAFPTANRASASLYSAAGAPPSSPADMAGEGCPKSRPVPLGDGVVATLYYGPQPSLNCGATWHEGSWAFSLSGDLNGGTGGDHSAPWEPIARGEVAYLAAHRVGGAAEGVFSGDIAPDGSHTSLAWRTGTDVYNASLYHGDALALAASMAPYPRLGRRLGASLIAFLDQAGIGVLDPANGGWSMLAQFPVPKYGFSGPVWGPAPGGGRPDLYFSVKQRPFYDWVFRADPWAGTLSTLAALNDPATGGPSGLAVAGDALGFTFGCCEDISAYAVPLGGRWAPEVLFSPPPRSVETSFMEGGAPDGRFVVWVGWPGARRPRPPWHWASATGATSPFPVPASVGRASGPVSFSPGEAQAAVALASGGLGVWSLAHPGSGMSVVGKSLGQAAAVSWGPLAGAVAIAAGGALRILSPTPGGALPSAIASGDLLAGQGVREVSWSGPLAAGAFGSLRPVPPFSADGQDLWAATKEPAGTKKVYVWQFDAQEVGNTTAAISTISGTPSRATLQSFPPLAVISGPDALANGHVTFGEQGQYGWMLGPPFCYHLDFTGVAGTALGARNLSLGQACPV